MERENGTGIHVLKIWGFRLRVSRAVTLSVREPSIGNYIK